MAAVEWTYDPLHAGNARFNLVKLGARVLSFHDDFYGEAQDTFGVGLGSDRFLVRWGVDDEPPALDAEDRESILRVGVHGEPVILETDGETCPSGDPVGHRQRAQGRPDVWRSRGATRSPEPSAARSSMAQRSSVWATPPT